MIENIRNAANGNIGYKVLWTYKNPFDTARQQILSAKLNHYGICGFLNDWFKSYLYNWYQCVSTNGYDSGLAPINCGLPQGSALVFLLFLLYINNFNQAIKLRNVHFFSYDTNLLCLSNSVKKLSKLVNVDKASS